MFRLSRYLLASQARRYTSLPFYQQRFFSNRSNQTTLLLNKANDLNNIGEIRAAENTYKKVINLYPHCKEAYQNLWMFVGTSLHSQSDCT